MREKYPGRLRGSVLCRKHLLLFALLALFASPLLGCKSLSNQTNEDPNYQPPAKPDLPFDPDLGPRRELFPLPFADKSAFAPDGANAGGGGKVSTDLFGDTDEIMALALQTDGKIVVAGTTKVRGTVNDPIADPRRGNDFAIARYNPDGGLDPSFGSRGILTTDFGGTNFGFGEEHALAVLIQPDGKIVAGGVSCPDTTRISTCDFGLGRYNSNGSLDANFGASGKVSTDFLSRADVTTALALQPDGKIVAAGVTFNPDAASPSFDFSLARYNPNGSLDASFGTGGKITTDFAGEEDRLTSLVIQPDGRIIAAGTTYDSEVTSSYNLALVRYNQDGSLDASFGAGGKVTTDFFSSANDPLDDILGRIALQPDGKIVAAGSSQPDGNSVDFLVARYNPNGSLDASFGTGGKVLTDFNSAIDVATSLVIQPDGKIVAGGTANGQPKLAPNNRPLAVFDVPTNAPGGSDFGLVRHNPDGSLDNGFVPGGKGVTDFFGSADAAMDMALQPDGKILAVGFAQTAPLIGSGEQEVRDLRHVNFALARYLTTGAPQPASTIQFSAPSYSVNENVNSITITVTRTGDTSGAASVDYATTDNRAEQKSDYTFAAGSLRFAAGEASKAFTILVTNDAFSESGPESLILSLSKPGGASLGNPALASVTINDDEIAGQPQPNPVGDAQFFARQHYADFLNREPDPSGLQFWTNEIVSCGADAQCVEVKRVNVSAAFFLSIEFQQTGYLLYRLHQAAFNTGPLLRFRTFLPDTQEIGRGVVVGAPGWEQQLELNKQAFVSGFASRPEFQARYPQTLSAAQFVDALNANTGGSLSQSERDALVAGLTNNTQTRAQVLRAVAEDSDFAAREFNRAFVYMQYVGYLRRGPSDAPDNNLNGYNFWLGKLNQFDGNFIQAEMVKAFISSIEYRARFGTP